MKDSKKLEIWNHELQESLYYIIFINQNPLFSIGDILCSKIEMLGSAFDECCSVIDVLACGAPTPVTQAEFDNLSFEFQSNTHLGHVKNNDKYQIVRSM